MITIGKRCRLTVLRLSPSTVVLDGAHLGDIELPRREAPNKVQAGMEISVFLTADAEGRPEATMRQPAAEVGDVAWLKVTSITGNGAFLDWGLPKDLLLPKREQLPDLKAGDYCMVKIFLDEYHRLTASELLNDFLDETTDEFEERQKVTLMIAESTDLGVKVVVNDRYWGLLYRDEIFTPLQTGQRVEGYIKKLRADRKLDVTLNASGYGRIEGAAGTVLTLLEAKGGFMPFTDKSDPDEVREVFGMSKKVFKQAIGSLFKERIISIEDNGIRLARAKR